MGEGTEIGPGGKMFLLGIAALADVMQIMIAVVAFGLSSVAQTANAIPVVGTVVALGLAATFMGMAFLAPILVTIVVVIFLSLGFSHFGAGFFGERATLRRIITLIAEIFVSWVPVWFFATWAEIALHNHHVRKEAEKMKNVEIEAV